MAVTSGERAQIASQGFLAGVASAAGHLQQIPGDAWDTIFRECPVPMFILPQGPDPEKYFIVFGFDEVFDNLKSGVFVCPRIEAWASRGTGWDIEHLGEELKTEFNRQFEVSRQRVVQSGSVDVSKLESEAERLAEEKSGKLERASSALIKSPMWLGMAGLAVNPFTWPVTWPFSLIFLALSLSHGRDIIKLSLEYFSLTSNNDATNRELRQRKRALEEQERKFDSKNESFQHAVGRIDVKVHPQLQDLYQQICQKEGVFFQPSASGPALPGVFPMPGVTWRMRII